MKRKRISKKKLKRDLLLNYNKFNEKYSKLLKEKELNIYDNNIIILKEVKLKFRSCVHKSKKQSLGEKTIENILLKNNKYFLKEVEFNNCINPLTKKKLRFDFYLPNNNLCIEYDGEQHFKSVIEFDGKDNGKALKKRKNLDHIKDEFCKREGIDLLRIRYDDINLDKDLSLILKNY